MVVVERKEAAWHHLCDAPQIWQVPGPCDPDKVLFNNFYINNKNTD
jgi:hypothetical protein